MDDPERVKNQIQLVRELSNELAVFIYGLPEDVWRDAEQYGSACDQWKVADVITHLISGASTYSLSISRAMENKTAPPMGIYTGTGGFDPQYVSRVGGRS